MAVYVGSARIDENGKARGGAAGDQKGEVSTQKWYKHSKGWRVLRAKDAAKAKKIAEAMQAACDNQKIGYDQGQRNTLYNVAKAVGFNPAKVTTACETDCSALVRVCCAYAGIMLADMYTGNQASIMLKSGAFEELTGSKYTDSSDYLKAGDVLVTKTKGHTVVVLDDGAKAGASATASTTSGSTASTYTLQQFVKDVQAATGSNVDGIAGPETIGNTVTVSEKINRKHKVVKAIQKRLYALGFTEVGTADGIAGPKFTKAVKAYQKKYCKVADGEITAKKTTWKKLLGMA